MSVTALNNYSGRVTLAARYISSGRETARDFDTCFEMYDGDAVALSLLRMATDSPQGPLAKNLWKYLCKDSVEGASAKYSHIDTKDLPKLAASLRNASQRGSRSAFATELTPEGEQTVIPGCEKNEAPGDRQLDLFG